MTQLQQGSKIHHMGSAEDLPKLIPGYQSFSGLFRLVCLKPLRIDGASRLASYLALHLPEVAARIDYDDLGILHLEMGALKLATRDAINRRDWHTVGKHFLFVADMMEDAGDELQDAIRVSYLESLFYDERSLNYAKARSLLPGSLSGALQEVERHYAEMES